MTLVWLGLSLIMLVALIPVIERILFGLLSDIYHLIFDDE